MRAVSSSHLRSYGHQRSAAESNRHGHQTSSTTNFGAYELTGTVTEVGSTTPLSGTISFLDTTNSNAVLGSALLPGKHPL